MFQKIIVILSSVLVVCNTITVVIPNRNEFGRRKGVILGDISYSYSATDIGTSNGTHVKTVTIIKNIAVPKSDISKPINEEITDDDWPETKSEDLRLVVKIPEYAPVSFMPVIPPINNRNNKKEQPKVVEIMDSNNNQTENEQFGNTKQMEEVKLNLNVEPVQFPMLEEDESDESSLQQAQMETNGTNQQEPAISETDAQRSAQAQSQRSDEAKSTQISAAIVTQQNIQPKAQSEQSDIAKAAHLTAAVAAGSLARIVEANENLQIPFIEDFSDYSLHNVKHLNDPSLKVKQEAEADNSNSESAGENNVQMQIATTMPTTTTNQMPYIAPRVLTSKKKIRSSRIDSISFF